MGIFFITLSTTMMKIVFIALCLFALAFADDTKSNCTTVATIPASCTGTQNTADPNEWVTVENLGAGANACYSVTFDDGFDSSEDVYVLATRNGDDGVPASNAAVTTTGFTNTTVIGCVSLTASQEEDDTDYLCSSQTATAYYTVVQTLEQTLPPLIFTLDMLKVPSVIVLLAMFPHLDHPSGCGLLSVLLLLLLSFWQLLVDSST